MNLTYGVMILAMLTCAAVADTTIKSGNYFIYGASIGWIHAEKAYQCPGIQREPEYVPDISISIQPSGMMSPQRQLVG